MKLENNKQVMKQRMVAFMEEEIVQEVIDKNLKEKECLSSQM